jgi:lysophospholipid acyltransferase (LPLAT)-like uncharacterized protein
MLGAMDPRSERQARRAAAARRDAERTARGRNDTALVRWRRQRRRVGGWLLAALAPLLLRLLAATWRVERLGEAGRELFDGDGPWIVVMWHGRMLPLLPLRGHRHRGLSVLVSPSDDGSLAAKLLQRFGNTIVRGSLSRGGARALREMRERLGSGERLVVTPDGPRGPRHGINAGAAWLARATAAPLVPLGVAVDRAWHLSSWDRFTIPKPFARLVVVYGDPVSLPADADDATVEARSRLLRERLLAAERRGFARLGVAHDLDDDGAATPAPAAPKEHDPGPSAEGPGS